MDDLHGTILKGTFLIFKQCHYGSIAQSLLFLYFVQQNITEVTG